MKRKEKLLYPGAELRSLMAEEPELRVCTFDEIDSTNSEAKRRATAGETGMLLLTARSQSAGRGRMGRSFDSPKSAGVYFSLLYSPSEEMSGAVRITSAAAVAVMRAIRKCTGKETEIKWVNDLYYRGKKVCGILCESLTAAGKPKIVIGIGINLIPRTFPPELEQIAGDLGESADRADLLIATVCRELFQLIRNPSDASWLKDYREASMVIGKQIRWSRGELSGEGTAVSIDEEGHLFVREATGNEILLDSGEISLRIKT